jgi:lipopolysaccharide/colanic/teichoic acid biosynthesis glycosyltransferase
MSLPRSLDIGLATAAGILLAPLVVVAALGVAIDIGRPVLFTQSRSGLRGRVFAMRKLRSMRNTVDAEGRLLPDAARLTPYGRFLRRSRIDELPGLWHVIVGDLGIVGPRPLLPATVAHMGAAGVARGAMRPGLTGWAQVNGNALLSDVDKLALDLWYIENASLGLDLRILLLTLWVIVAGERVNHAELGRADAGDHRRGG